MITGTIRQREAIIIIEVRGPSGASRRVGAVIDTGFNGYLTLAADLIAALGLPFAGHRRGTLADGRATRLNMHLASVIWHGRPRDVMVTQTAGKPLIGMALLEGSQRFIDAAEGGAVRVESKADTRG